MFPYDGKNKIESKNTIEYNPAKIVGMEYECNAVSAFSSSTACLSSFFDRIEHFTKQMLSPHSSCYFTLHTTQLHARFAILHGFGKGAKGLILHGALSQGRVGNRRL